MESAAAKLTRHISLSHFIHVLLLPSLTLLLNLPLSLSDCLSCLQCDKLREVGFEIYAWVDRRSRRILRMVVCENNRGTHELLHEYLDLIEEFGAVPVKLCMDQGTEAVLLQVAQVSLRRHHTDAYAGVASFQIARANGQVPVERRWGTARTHVWDFWRAMHQDMVHQGEYVANSNVCRFLFHFLARHLVQRDITEHVAWSNSTWMRYVYV